MSNLGGVAHTLVGGVLGVGQTVGMALICPHVVNGSRYPRRSRAVWLGERGYAHEVRAALNPYAHRAARESLGGVNAHLRVVLYDLAGGRVAAWARARLNIKRWRSFLWSGRGLSYGHA